MGDSIPLEQRSATAPAASTALFRWPRDVSSAEKKSLIGGGLGWMLDAMDVMLYSLALPETKGKQLT